MKTLQRTLPPAVGCVLLLGDELPAQEALRNTKAVQDEAKGMGWKLAPVCARLKKP